MKNVSRIAFRNWYLVNNPYASSYIKDPSLINEELITRKWIDALREISLKEPLSKDAIASFIELFGERSLLCEFRGVHGKGLIGYVPKDVDNAHCQNPAMF